LLVTLVGKGIYASGWRVIAFNSSMEQISELTRFDGALIALPFPSCQIRCLFRLARFEANLMDREGA
jgi:hypothetical protein